VCAAVGRAVSVVLSGAVSVVEVSLVVRFAVGDAVDGQYHQKRFYGDVRVKTRATC
jgi:hypothetical protein